MSKDKEQKAPEEIRSQVRKRYGQIASEFRPEAVASCCGPAESATCGCGPKQAVDVDISSALYETSDVSDLPEEVTGLSLGCGDPVTLASLQPGQTVLDLGSGGGIDCFLAAKRVGEDGRVIGVDMTAEMIEKARANKAKLGLDNVEFRLGEIEHLPVADETVDVIISNCVINLSPDKPQAFREAFRVLRPGGLLAVSDIVTAGPLPDVIKESMAAWAGCVAGALEDDAYVSAIEAAGFVDVCLEPVYFDKALVDQAVEQLGLRQEAGDGKGSKAIFIVDGRAVETELPESEPQSDGSIYRAIYSAKVMARKPAR